MGDVGVLNFDLTFLQEIIFNWVCVGIVAYVLYRILYNPILKFMNARAERISGEIDDAKKQLEEAKKLKEEYEMKLKNIEKERIEILDTARKRSAEREEQIVLEAKNEAQTIKDRALIDIEREKDKAQDEMRRQIIEISSLIAGKFIKSKMNDKELGNLLDASISDLGDVKWPS